MTSETSWLGSGILFWGAEAGEYLDSNSLSSGKNDSTADTALVLHAATAHSIPFTLYSP